MKARTTTTPVTLETVTPRSAERSAAEVVVRKRLAASAAATLGMIARAPPAMLAEVMLSWISLGTVPSLAARAMRKASASNEVMSPAMAKVISTTAL